MKLYVLTEEQLNKLLKDSKEYCYQDFFPVVLPTDEEIEDVFPINWIHGESTREQLKRERNVIVREGISWMRDKIINQLPK